MPGISLHPGQRLPQEKPSQWDESQIIDWLGKGQIAFVVRLVSKSHIYEAAAQPTIQSNLFERDVKNHS
jgi:hypothetical protein